MFDSSNYWILFFLAFISWLGLCYLNASNPIYETHNSHTVDLNPFVYFIALIQKTFTIENHLIFAICLSITVTSTIICRYVFRKLKSIYCSLNYLEQSISNCLKGLENNNYFINYERRKLQKECIEYKKNVEKYMNEKNDIQQRILEYKKCMNKLKTKLLSVESERNSLKRKLEQYDRNFYVGCDTIKKSTTVLYDRHTNESNANQIVSKNEKEVYSKYEAAFIHQVLNETLTRDSDFNQLLNTLNMKLFEMENFFFGNNNQKSLSNELQTQINKNLEFVSTEQLQKIKFSNTDLRFKEHLMDTNSLATKSKKFQEFCKNLYIGLKK